MKLVIAGGGTGGHLFPGIAVAEEFLALSVDNEVLFVGTKKGIEARAVPKAGYNLECIEVIGLKNKGLLSKLKSLFMLPNSLFQSFRILSKSKADVVLGVGGYASGPLLLAAFLKGLPTAICEQNSVPGLTNKILSKLVKTIFVSFEDIDGYLPVSKVKYFGNPVRKQFLDVVQNSKTEQEVIERGRIFVFGGSQGARPLNQMMPNFLSDLQRKLGDSLELNIIHQCGRNNTEAVQKKYEELEVKVKVEVVEFIDQMIEQYQKAELIICRSGATSCAEISVVGAAAAFIPFPQATDDHQSKNARNFVENGAAYLFEQSKLADGEYIEIVKSSLLNPELLMHMRDNMTKMAFPEAGKNIAKALQNHLSGDE